MLKIVVADDEEFVRRGLEVIISESGRDYMVAGCYSNGQEALDKLLNSDCDVLITDIRMPKLDGLQLIESLNDMNKDIACIILSGYNDFEYARKALRFGVEDYLLKPVDHNEMFQCLDNIRNRKFGTGNSGDNVDNNSKRVIMMVKKIIESEYSREFKLLEISERVFLNPNYLSRLFKKETGINISDYLIHVRMEKAKELFRNELELKVYEVAEKVGYTDPVFFNKLFKRIVGMTPGDYRETC